MRISDWMYADLDEFAHSDEALAYAVPGDTPGQSADLDALHEVFHEQTKYHRATAFGLFQNIAAHMESPDLIARSATGRHPSSHDAIQLPDPVTLELSLGDAFARRRTHPRQATAQPLSATVLSSLLHYAVRANRSAPIEKVPALTQHFAPYPSAGALYPCELYLSLSAVEGLPAGVYRYHSVEHTLSPCSHSERDSAGFSACEPALSDDQVSPACAIIISSVFQRSVRKYGTRGYRLAVLEAGHILQNLSLVAAALALPSLVSASFYEAELESHIGVDGVSEAVLACFLCGARANE